MEDDDDAAAENTENLDAAAENTEDAEWSHYQRYQVRFYYLQNY